MPPDATYRGNRTAREILYDRAALPFIIGAAGDVLLGFDLLLTADFLGEWLAPGVGDVAGVAIETVLRATGACLLGVALFTLSATWYYIPRGALWLIVGLNEAWVLASAALVIFAHDRLSLAGDIAVIAVAAVLAILTWLQYRALRKLPA